MVVSTNHAMDCCQAWCRLTAEITMTTAIVFAAWSHRRRGLSR
jgi:hypothetical protein